MRMFTIFGAMLGLTAIAVMVSTGNDSKPGRTLTRLELATLFGGDDMRCCKHWDDCDGSARTCAEPIQGEDPEMDPEMRYLGRNETVINIDYSEHCDEDSQVTPDCIAFGDTYDCKIVYECYFDNTALACKKDASGMTTTTVYEFCNPACST